MQWQWAESIGFNFPGLNFEPSPSLPPLPCTPCMPCRCQSLCTHPTCRRTSLPSPGCPHLPCPAGNLFNPTIGPEVKAFILDKLSKKLAYLNDTLLKGKKFVVGDKWTIADSYLYICLTW